MATRKALVNDFALRSFRDIADQDYIAARLAYRAQLVPQFLWASQQAIEKYLKCILLLNRIAAPGVRHQLSKALELIEQRAPFQLRLSDQSKAFIKHVDTYGLCRYLESSIYVRRYEIVRLDRAVWDIRRYCDVLDYIVKMPNRGDVHMLDVEIQKIERSEVGLPKPYPLSGGLLERIVDSKEHAAQKPLIWQNLYFGGRPRKAVHLRPYSHATNSPLSLHPEIVDDLIPLVKLSKRVVMMCRDQVRQRSLLATKMP